MSTFSAGAMFRRDTASRTWNLTTDTVAPHNLCLCCTLIQHDSTIACAVISPSLCCFISRYCKNVAPLSMLVLLRLTTYYLLLTACGSASAPTRAPASPDSCFLPMLLLLLTTTAAAAAAAAAATAAVLCASIFKAGLIRFEIEVPVNSVRKNCKL